MSARTWIPLAIGLVAGCAEPAPPGPVPTGERFAVVTTSEFGAAGSLAVVDLDTLQVYPDLTTTHHDAWIRTGSAGVYVLNRQGADNVQLLDPSGGFATRWERSVGQRANPWDLVELGDGRAAVLLYGEQQVALVDLAAWDMAAAPRISPGPGAEEDGRVEPGALHVRDGVLYVLVQGLGRYPRCAPQDRGRVHAYGLADGLPVEEFGVGGVLELAACNPLSWVVGADDTAWIAMSGNHRSLVGDEAVDDGALERVDLRAGRSLGVLATEVDLGDADLLRIASGAEGRLWAVLAHADFSMSVREAHVDTDGGVSLGPAVWTGEGIFTVAEHDGRLWIADRRRPGAALVVLDADDPLAGAPVLLDTGYAPYDIAFIETVSAP